jgi:hypothetical protein
MILHGGFALGLRKRGSAEQIELSKAFLAMMGNQHRSGAVTALAQKLIR